MKGQIIAYIWATLERLEFFSVFPNYTKVRAIQFPEIRMMEFTWTMHEAKLRTRIMFCQMKFNSYQICIHSHNYENGKDSYDKIGAMDLGSWIFIPTSYSSSQCLPVEAMCTFIFSLHDVHSCIACWKTLLYEVAFSVKPAIRLEVKLEQAEAFHKLD